MGRLRMPLVAVVLITAAGLLTLRLRTGSGSPPDSVPAAAPGPGPTSAATAADQPGPGGAPRNPDSPDPKFETALFLSETLETAPEPFSEDVLERLESLLSSTTDLETRLRIAAVLHRYHRTSGTEFLLKMGDSRGELAETALTALALSKTPQALGLITRQIAGGTLSGEFLDALGAWPDPAITAALRTRLDSGAPPGPLLARALVLQGDRSMTDPARPSSTDWPAQQLEAAALAARAAGNPDPSWKQHLSEGVKPGSGLDAGLLVLGSRIAGPEAARPGMTDFLREYAGTLERWNQDYAAYVRDLRQGRREWTPVSFDVLPWATAMSGAELLGDWGPDPRAANAVQQLLAVYLQGRHTPAAAEQLMQSLMHLDPAGAGSRLDALGVDPAQTDSVRHLSTLNPLPEGLQPRQGTKHVPIPIPGEE